jgi:hypothetical protein
VITAVDTNILLDVLIPNPACAERSAVALDLAAAVGSLVICDAACAELCLHFPTQRECDDFPIECVDSGTVAERRSSS